MRRPRPDSLAARLRAAQAYAGVSNPDLAEELGVSVETLSRMKNGKTTIPETVPGRVADFCGVPKVFMDVGFAPLERPITDVERRVLDLEDRVAGTSLAAPEVARELAQRLQVAHIVPASEGGTNEVSNLVLIDPEAHLALGRLHQDVQRLQRLVAELTPSAADEPPAPPGELLQPPGVGSPTRRTARGTDSGAGKDAQRGTGG